MASPKVGMRGDIGGAVFPEFSGRRAVRGRHAVVGRRQNRDQLTISTTRVGRMADRQARGEHVQCARVARLHARADANMQRCAVDRATCAPCSTNRRARLPGHGRATTQPIRPFAAHLQIADIERRLTLREILIGEQAVDVLSGNCALCFPYCWRVLSPEGASCIGYRNLSRNYTRETGSAEIRYRHRPASARK